MHIQGQACRVCMNRQEVSKKGPFSGCDTHEALSQHDDCSVLSKWYPQGVVEASCWGGWPSLFAAPPKLFLCCTCLSSLQERENAWHLPVSDDAFTLATVSASEQQKVSVKAYHTILTDTSKVDPGLKTDLWCLHQGESCSVANSLREHIRAMIVKMSLTLSG